MRTSDERKSILFVHNNNDLYGAEVVLLELIRGLDRTLFKPMVVLPADVRHINRLSAKLQEEGIPFRFIRMGVIRRRYFGPLGIIRFALNCLTGVATLVWIALSHRIDIIHSNTVSVPCGAIAAKLLRRPHIWHVHEMVTRPAVARRIVHRFVTRMSTVVVAVSNAVKNHILEDCPGQAEKIRVILNGIDVDRFAESTENSAIRQQFGISEQDCLVGMVGKVCRWKGQLLLVEAARLVCALRPDISFLAVGGVFDDERYYMDAFRDAVVQSGLESRFRISDYSSDVRPFLRAFDIFVLPSTEPDPFPTVVLEAMASGRPVVASGHGGPIEMIVEGETGLLFTPGSAESLASAVLSLSGNMAHSREMGRNGQKRAVQFFTSGRYVQEFGSLYSELAHQAKGVEATRAELSSE